MTDEQIRRMVDRFLAWNLPADFNPDGGISFDPVASKGTPYEFLRAPVGTNLLTAMQADAMVRHMIEGMPGGCVYGACADEGLDEHASRRLPPPPAQGGGSR